MAKGDHKDHKNLTTNVTNFYKKQTIPQNTKAWLVHKTQGYFKTTSEETSKHALREETKQHKFIHKKKQAESKPEQQNKPQQQTRQHKHNSKQKKQNTKNKQAN